MNEPKTRGKTAVFAVLAGTLCVGGVFVPAAWSLGFGKATTVALELTYEGDDPQFLGTYQIGDPFLPPGIRVEPLASARTAASFSVDVIEGSGLDDHVGAVGFSVDTDWIEPLTGDYDAVRARLRGATAGMGSDLAAGMRAALDELQSFRGRNYAGKMVVIITDGQTDDLTALAQAQELAAEGVIVHVIGVGCDVNTVLLREIASVGRGMALFVPNGTDPATYGSQISAMLQGIAADEVTVALIQ